MQTATAPDTAPTTDHALVVDSLTKSFVKGKVVLTVLHPISFSIAQGSSTAIMGPSGSGKTTLLGLCAGLDRPTSGSILLAGARLEQMNEDQRAALRSRQVGFVFQNFQLVPTLTALENVMVPLELRGDRNVAAQAREWLSHVGLAQRADHYPAQLSGGEQQRIALARAFVTRPTVLFADEPTGNLDADNSEAIANLLFQLNREVGTTLILSTHNPELAARTGRILQIRGGHLVS